jgi:plasmid stabilization system protein ParE
MADKVKISSLAQKEFDESSLWYEDQAVGLGERFANNIYKCIDVILIDPKVYHKTKGNLREFVVDGFPFIILYEYDGAIVNILHFFHTSRNPKLKYRRK